MFVEREREAHILASLCERMQREAIDLVVTYYKLTAHEILYRGGGVVDVLWKFKGDGADVAQKSFYEWMKKRIGFSLNA